MEDDATQSGSQVGPGSSGDELKNRLSELEQEARRLREQLAAQHGDQAVPPTPPSHPTFDSPINSSSLGNPASSTSPPSPTGQAEPSNLTAPPQAPTREQLDKADRLIQMARLAKNRGQTGQAATYLKQAEEAAPNAPTVLEYIGDQFVEQKRMSDARASYKKAFDLDPKNVGLERKWAQTIAASAPMGDAIMMSEYESMASGKVAAVLSAIIPGLGQVVLGEFAKGAMIFVAWAAMILWLYLIPSGLKGIVAIFSQRASQQEPFHAVVFVPIFIMFVIWISAMFDAKLTTGLGRKPIARPIPPDARPFE